MPREFVGVGWAISIEFQFYLVFPFLIRFVQRYGARYLMGLLVLAWMLRSLATIGSASMRDLAYFSLVGRIDDFVIGMAAGVLYVRAPKFVEKLRYAIPLGFSLPIAAVYAFHRLGGFDKASAKTWFFWPPFEAVAWAAFLLCYLGAAAWLPKFLLLHFTVISLLVKQGWVFAIGHRPIGAALLYTALVVTPLVLAMSSITYFVIEKPFLGLRKVYVRHNLEPGTAASKNEAAAA